MKDLPAFLNRRVASILKAIRKYEKKHLSLLMIADILVSIKLVIKFD